MRTTSLLLLSVLLLCPGCGSGYLAHLIAGPGKVKAIYTLEDRPTLILVDDPGERFANPNLPPVVAVHVEHHLGQNTRLAPQIISLDALADLEAELGEDYALTPIDALGRRAGAEQVIYILVENVSMETAPGIYRPSAQVQVKVINVATGRRLFPPVTSIQEPDAPSRGRSVMTRMAYKGGSTSSRGASARFKQRLAETLGRDVARLFYDWKKPKIGSRFDEP